MTGLANVSALTRTPAQLPIEWYFDPQIADIERKMLFANGPGYVGHELMVPEVGNYRSLDWMHHAKVLVRSQNGVELLSNVCRHRQSIMLKGSGHAQNIVCPLHRWTYDLSGKLLGAPHFPGNPCLDLGKTALTGWNGLQFAGPRDPNLDLARLGVLADLDFSGYRLDRIMRHEYAVNWKTFIEVYLEDYHVAPFHPGLGQFVNADDLRWEFGDRHSVQTVGAKNELSKPGSPAYRKWHDAVLKYRNGVPPKHGAIWLTYYPGVMVEWYPHVLVVSTLHPRGPQKTLNVVEFFYPEEIAAFEREFVEAEQAAYWETCAEDDEIALRMDAGRRALFERGDDDFGPYQSPMEDGMQQFHEWYQKAMR